MHLRVRIYLMFYESFCIAYLEFYGFRLYAANRTAVGFIIFQIIMGDASGPAHGRLNAFPTNSSGLPRFDRLDSVKSFLEELATSDYKKYNISGCYVLFSKMMCTAEYGGTLIHVAAICLAYEHR